MVAIQFIRENTEAIVNAAKLKNIPFDVEALLSIDKERRETQQECDNLKAKQNQANAGIAAAQGEDKQVAILAMKAVAGEVKALQAKLSEVEEQFHKLMLLVPNIMSDNVPVGTGEEGNVVAEVIGEIPQFDFKVRDHIELMKMHDMIDIQRGVKLSGSRGYILKNDAAMLEQAVLQYALKKMVEKGFTPMQVPYIVNTPTMGGTGYLTEENKDDAYHLAKDDKWLIATAEIPLTAYHSGEILEEADLPKTYVALSPCFRREAGSYGKDTHGLYRIHQFTKVEQVVVIPADIATSDQWHETILSNARDVLDDLKMPYRLLQLCTGDLALGKYNSHDLECWMPSRESYGETHSASSLLDFQARRLNIRYRTKDGEIKHCYTLNNTVIATPRFLIALLENFQQEDGSILIPEVLQPYMGKAKIG
jgi:seryl-tRNA synthetase